MNQSRRVEHVSDGWSGASPRSGWSQFWARVQNSPTLDLHTIIFTPVLPQTLLLLTDIHQFIGLYCEILVLLSPPQVFGPGSPPQKWTRTCSSSSEKLQNGLIGSDSWLESYIPYRTNPVSVTKLIFYLWLEISFLFGSSDGLVALVLPDRTSEFHHCSL